MILQVTQRAPPRIQPTTYVVYLDRSFKLHNEYSTSTPRTHHQQLIDPSSYTTSTPRIHHEYQVTQRVHNQYTTNTPPTGSTTNNTRTGVFWGTARRFAGVGETPHTDVHGLVPVAEIVVAAGKEGVRLALSGAGTWWG